MATNTTRSTGQINTTMVQAQAAGQHTALAAFTYHNSQAAAVLSRLVSPKMAPNFDNVGNRTVSRPNVANLKSISSKVADAATNAENILYLFSDVKIACEILISSIRSPNDMYEGEVNFELKDNLHIMPIAERLLPMVRSYFKDVYPLGNKFETILREALFGAGAYPILVMPENSLSDLIYGTPNLSTESVDPKFKPVAKRRYARESFMSEMRKMGKTQVPSSVGYLGTSKVSKFSSATEAFMENSSGVQADSDRYLSGGVDEKGHKIVFENIVVHDNPDAMQMNMFLRLASESTKAERREKNNPHDKGVYSDRDLAKLLYRNTSGRDREFVKIKTDKELKRYSVGRPFIFDLPPESVVPVVSKSRTKDPVGFIIVLDADGAPLSRHSESTQFDELRRNALSANASMGNAGAHGDMSSYLLNKTASAFKTECGDVQMQQVNKIFAQILEADISARFRNGYLGTEVTVADIERVSELMLFRQFSNQRTQMVFVPAEMMVYFAYDHRSNGTGKNMLEDSLVISSLRAQLLFARVMGAVKNSIGRRRVSVMIDPDDQDPQATFDTIKAEVVFANQINTAPTSIMAADIMNQVQATGLEFEVEGNEGLPNTKVSFTEVNSNYSRPDEDLANELSDLMINHIGVPPEMIEEARRANFATVAIANNILFSKRVRDMQRRFDPQLTRLATSMLMADSTFIIEMKKVIIENINDVKKEHDDLDRFADNQAALVDFLCMEFISNLVASLARPDLKSIENNLEALSKNTEIIKAAVEAFFSENVIDASMIGEAGFASLPAFQKAIEGALIRRFIAENGILPEIGEILTKNEDGDYMWNIAQEIQAHAAGVADVILGAKKGLTRIALAADAEMSKLPKGPDPEQGGSSYDSGGGGGGGEDYGSSSDDGFGEDAGGEFTSEFTEDEGGGGSDPLDDLLDVPAG